MSTVRSPAPCYFPTKLNKYLKNIAPYGILAVISVAVFINTLSNTFVYDDSATIVNNNLIKNWKNLHSIFSFHYFILSGELSYRPVVTLSYFIDYFLWGLNPAGFHLTNILIQTANTVLFYVFLKKVTKVETVAFVSTLLFITHPILTETVNSISYREDILAALFFLIAFVLFLKIDEKSLTRGKFFTYYAGSLFSCLLSLFSKEMAVTFPIMLMLFNVFSATPASPLRSMIKRAKGVYIGYFLITGFYLFIRFVLFRHAYIRLDQTQQGLFVMVKVIASYIKLLFFPFNLNADYVVPSVTAGIPSFIISVLFVITTVILLIRLCQNNKEHGFFLSWFFVTLLPVLNIIPIGNIMAERYLYIPIMGFCGAIGILIKNCTLKKNFTTICLGTVIVIFSGTSVHRNGIWRDELTLWHSTVNREPNSTRAHHNLGVVHSLKGFYDYAEFKYKKTLEINPRDVESHYNLGNAYERKGMPDTAIKEYQEALRYNPVYADAYNNLGGIYKNKRFFGRAIEFYKKAIQCNPFNPYYYNNLGLAYHENKLYKEAITEFRRTLQIDSGISTTHNNLGNTYKEMGNFGEALTEFKTALKLDPANADTHNNLGVVYIGTEQFDKAINEFDTAIQIDPKLANVHNNLGIAYAQKGYLDRAVNELNEAVARGFDNADVHNNLAGIYLTKGSTDNAIAELKMALKYNPADSNAHCNLGNAYMSKNLVDEAISEFKEAVKYHPDDGEIYYYLGNAFYRKGQYSESVDSLRRSVHYQPNNPLTHKMLGVIYANYLNNPSGALFHLNETLRLDPRQSMAKEIKEFISKLKK
ncbi:MAG: tetratricopeptide repeat protein [Candidatus Brocadia sp.]|nr:tetratricopeptide repeat protein [Candidatus Brocadia sp.]